MRDGPAPAATTHAQEVAERLVSLLLAEGAARGITIEDIEYGASPAAAFKRGCFIEMLVSRT